MRPGPDRRALPHPPPPPLRHCHGAVMSMGSEVDPWGRTHTTQQCRQRGGQVARIAKGSLSAGSRTIARIACLRACLTGHTAAYSVCMMCTAVTYRQPNVAPQRLPPVAPPHLDAVGPAQPRDARARPHPEPGVQPSPVLSPAPSRSGQPPAGPAGMRWRDACRCGPARQATHAPPLARWPSKRAPLLPSAHCRAPPPPHKFQEDSFHLVQWGFTADALIHNHDVIILDDDHCAVLLGFRRILRGIVELLAMIRIPVAVVFIPRTTVGVGVGGRTRLRPAGLGSPPGRTPPEHRPRDPTSSTTSTAGTPAQPIGPARAPAVTPARGSRSGPGPPPRRSRPPPAPHAARTSPRAVRASGPRRARAAPVYGPRAAPPEHGAHTASSRSSAVCGPTGSESSGPESSGSESTAPYRTRHKSGAGASLSRAARSLARALSLTHSLRVECSGTNSGHALWPHKNQ